MSTWVYPHSNNLLTLSQAAIVTTARHLCTSENSVDNFYALSYQPPNYLRVYSVVFLYPSAVRWVSLSFSVVWCGRMSFSEHTATTYKDRCSGLASNVGRRLEEQRVLDGSAWCLPLGSSMWKKTKVCDFASVVTTSVTELSMALVVHASETALI